MAIEQMELLSIVGKEENMNQFISKYLLNSGMQLEDALKVYEKGWRLSYFNYDPKVKDNLKFCKDLMKKIDIEYTENYVQSKLEGSVDELHSVLEDIDIQINDVTKSIKSAEDEIKNIENLLYPIGHLRGLKINLADLYNLKYIKFRYGRISKNNYDKLMEDVWKYDTVIVKVEEELDYVWIIYLTTEEYSAKIDSFFNVMKFERIWINQDIQGRPEEYIKRLENMKEENINILKRERAELISIKKKYEPILISLYRQFQTYEKINNLKKYIAHDSKGDFYIIGWIPKDELKALKPKLDNENDIQYKIKSNDEVASTPPTYLKNNWFARKFETIVEMYGTPNYQELDPTLFVALTAFLMFGFMFGDVGHGLVIAIVGFIMAKKKISLGSVLTAGGISAMIFGVLYGSIFGREDIIPAILISPMENIQTMLIAGIAVGVILIVLAIILNIYNGIKNKDKKRIFLSENGLAGLIFYVLVISAVIYYFVKGKMILPTGVLIAIIVILLAIIMFKDRIINVIEKSKEKEKTPIVEIIFELIETLLSFVSNTVSFVRIAAFAINHVGLCMAVYILSNMATGAGSLIIAIIGNILVIALEGLIVGIQVLRLEYYELFSRFYVGDGKKYRPIREEIA